MTFSMKHVLAPPPLSLDRCRYLATRFSREVHLFDCSPSSSSVPLTFSFAHGLFFALLFFLKYDRNDPFELLFLPRFFHFLERTRFPGGECVSFYIGPEFQSEYPFQLSPLSLFNTEVFLWGRSFRHPKDVHFAPF